jgi:adenylate cyclase
MPATVNPRVSLRLKWTVALLLTAALPITALVMATVRIQREGLENAERLLEASVIDHVGTLVDHTLDGAAEATHRVGAILFDQRLGNVDAKVDLARDAMARSVALAEVAIYGRDGRLVDAIRRKEDTATPPAPDALPEGAREIEFESGRFLAPTVDRGTVVFRYVEPIVRAGTTVAWVVGTLRHDALEEEIASVALDRFSRADGLMLLDRDGRVIAGGGGGEFAVGSSVAGRDLFATKPLPERFARQVSIEARYTAKNGEEMVGFAQTLDARGLTVFVRRPTSEVYQALGRTRRLLAGAAFGLTLLAIAIGAWLAARTVRPVRALVDLTRAYAKREFARRSPVKTGDELELLGNAMEVMATDIEAGEKEIARRAEVQASLSRYLPGEVAKSIAEGKQQLSLGGERRVVSILFADVVSFTPFAESAPPERAVALLNELFTVLTEVVFRHGGTIDKFVGDAVMAIFGAPTAFDDHAARALATAEDMHRFVEANAPTWKKKYGVDVKLGIGVSTGEALVGNLGSEARMEYTAIGDAVNVAARLEALAGPGQTLVTAQVAEAAGDAFEFTPLGERPLRGKKQPVSIMELM